MDKAIATIVGIVLVLGLIGYAILGQVAGAKDMGDMAAMEQHKVTQMLHDPNIVTGSTVKHYSRVGVSITIDPTTNIDNVLDGALYKMTKTYNESGKLTAVNFKQIDLSK